MVHKKFVWYLFCFIFLILIVGCKKTNFAKQNIQALPDLNKYAYCMLDNTSGRSPVHISVFAGDKAVAELNIPAGDKKIIMLEYPKTYRVKKDGADPGEDMNVLGNMIIKIASNGGLAIGVPNVIPPPPPAAATRPAGTTPPAATTPPPAAATRPAAATPPAATTRPVAATPPAAAVAPAATTAAPTPKTFILKDSGLDKPLVNTFVRYVIVPSITAVGNEGLKTSVEYASIDREYNNDAKSETTDGQGKLLIKDTAMKNGDILLFLLQNGNDRSGYVKYQRITTADNVEIKFSDFSNDPIRKNFRIRIQANNFLTGEDLRAEFIYRLKGESQFESLNIDNIHIERNSGYFTVTPKELNISLFSTLEYRLRLQGMSNDGFSITVENKTLVSRQLDRLSTDSVLQLDQVD